MQLRETLGNRVLLPFHILDLARDIHGQRFSLVVLFIYPNVPTVTVALSSTALSQVSTSLMWSVSTPCEGTRTDESGMQQL